MNIYYNKHIKKNKKICDNQYPQEFNIFPSKKMYSYRSKISRKRFMVNSGSVFLLKTYLISINLRPTKLYCKTEVMRFKL